MNPHENLHMRASDYLRYGAATAAAAYNYYGKPFLRSAGDYYNTFNNKFSKYIYRPVRNIAATGYLADRLFSDRQPRSHYGATRRTMFVRRKPIRHSLPLHLKRRPPRQVRRRVNYRLKKRRYIR